MNLHMPDEEDHGDRGVVHRAEYLQQQQVSLVPQFSLSARESLGKNAGKPVTKVTEVAGLAASQTRGAILDTMDILKMLADRRRRRLRRIKPN